MMTHYSPRLLLFEMGEIKEAKANAAKAINLDKNFKILVIDDTGLYGRH